MSFKRGRYSWLIRPLLYCIDILLLLLFIKICHPVRSTSLYFTPFLIIGWLISTFITRYYKVHRFTNPVSIINNAIKQYLLFALIYTTYFSFGPTILDVSIVLQFLTLLFVSFLSVKGITYVLLKAYRIRGGNKRNTIIIGYTPSTQALTQFFKDKKIYGYTCLGFFTNKDVLEKKGAIADCFSYITDNNIDDIYCAINELSASEIKALVTFANTHFKTLKFIPESNQIMSAGFNVDYYDYFPVLTMNTLSLNSPTNRLLKRSIDIVFSLTVIVTVLSWLMPLLFILIKINSKGPLFYIQDRNGLDYKKFRCYKFRTLSHQKNTAVNHVKTNDKRVTLLGKFLRKTSIDELPQFFNVLKGDMSIVGPRPHMLAYNKQYATQVDNLQLMARHKILPGITGLAQIRGYRGAIETNADISGRIKLDVFYIKNWSLLLDIKIVLQTIIKVIFGDKKAY